jgi:hypothetical protein
MDYTSIPPPAVQDIRLSALNVDQLKRVCKLLGLPVKGYKNDLIERIKQRHIADKDRTVRVILAVLQSAPGGIPAAAGPDSSSSGGLHYYPHQQQHQQHQQLRPNGIVGSAAAAAIGGTPLAPATSREAIIAMNPRAIEELEVNSHLGLIENCRVVGLTCVEWKHPHVNVYMTKPITEEERLGLKEERYKMVVRFLLYIPETNTWTFTPIWPKETKLTMGKEVIFDTFTKNRLGMTSVSFKEPAPAVDITDKFLALQTLGPVMFQISVQLVATGRKWVVCTSLLKKKMKTNLLSEILQRSPTVSQCTQRVLKFFSEGEDGLGIQDLEISLRDPASLQPIKIAARGIHCLHLQCFDLFTFVDMHDHARQPSWNCPMCGKKAIVRDLITDSWFQLMVDNKGKAENSSRLTKARVLANATYEFIVEEDDSDDEEEQEQEEMRQRQFAQLNAQEEMKRQRLSTPSDVVLAPLVAPINHTQPAPVSRRPKQGKSRDDAIELFDNDDILF